MSFISGMVYSQEFTHSNLPIVVLETNGQNIPNEPKVNINMGIIYNGPGQLNYLTDPFNEYDGVIGIEKRGSSSQAFFPKKQYAIETRDSLGNNFNVSVLGMPAENDWILHAPYSDKTFMRNVLTYHLAGEMGHYSTRTVYCELLIDGDYKGIYVIVEKIKRDGNRVDISEMDEDDLQGDSLTGGYIIKVDKLDGAYTSGWNSQFPPYPGAWQQVYYQYHYPKAANIQNAQKQYIQQFIYDFESVMNSSDYNDPISGYPSIIDVKTFVDFVLVNEFTKNVDGYRLSTYFTKDRDSKNGKLKMGPVWDYNIALGNADYFTGYDPEGWMINAQNSTNDYYILPFWWEKLMEDPAFYQLMVLRWNVFRQSILSDDYIINFIDQTVNELDGAQQRNFERWPILGEYVWPNYFIGDTYTEEVDYLKTWINSRVEWMDEELKLQPIISEINYFSDASIDAGDWIEIYNPLDQMVNLSGWQIKNDDDLFFEFPNATYLSPTSYLVVCEDLSKFETIFPGLDNVFGEMQMEIQNQGETLSLFDASGLCVDMLSFTDVLPWPEDAAGSGFTIELIYYLTDNSKGESWQRSVQLTGTPSATNSVSFTPLLYINEIMADNESVIMDEYGEFDDWIEIYNASYETVNVGGKYITDDLSVPLKYQIPNTDPAFTSIPSGGFLLLWADKEPAQGVLHLDFKLSKENEEVGLFLADGISVIDTMSFSDLENDISLGREFDGGSPWVLFNDPTPGVSNQFTSVITIEVENSMIYPNPARSIINLNLVFGNSLSIVDMMGNIHFQSAITAETQQINISHLIPGVYFLILRGNGLHKVERFIKLR